MVVTFLTGGRPDLLSKSLQSLLGLVAPELYDHKLMALANGEDKATIKVLEHFEVPYIRTPTMLPIGPALSMLADYALLSGEQYWLSCEDDWRAVGNQLKAALKILKRHPEISQVRLRHISEPVMVKHMVTGKYIKWHKKIGWQWGEAHRTFNNNLTRTADIRACFPCTGERDCQKQWLASGKLLAAQVNPGMFKHIGGSNSLREKTQCEL